MNVRLGVLRAPRSAVLRFAVAAFVVAAHDPAHAASGEDDSGPAATPYRPSVSTPAALSAPGWLEIEAGLQDNHDSVVARRESAPLTFKLAFTPDWGIRLGIDGWVHTHDDPDSESGVGDTSLVLKRRFAIDDDSAFGLEAGVTVPTARHGLASGSGKADWSVTAIHSADFGPWHSDLNLAATRLGAPEAETSRTQLLWAGALSRSLGDRWSVVAELSGTHRGGVDDTRQLLVATSLNVSRRFVVDAGGARSLRNGAPVWSAFTGFTWLAARLF
jgi:hypothetical protein